MIFAPPTPARSLAPAFASSRLEKFITERALPLWASSGFDRQTDCFHERLEFSSAPVREVPRRLMVQARQIVVYARASLSKWYKDDQQCAERAFETACRRYRSPDENPGWVFSVLPDGSPADLTRDLYAHAFVLYMLAWMHKLTSDPSTLLIADTTLSDIDRIFVSGDQAGYFSRVPGRTDLREQNPHMHLFEALLALAETSGAERYLARAHKLIDLFDNALTDSASGTVREMFDAQWRPEQPPGENSIEPGHQMEWIWLLREWERLTGSRADERVHRLSRHATTFGIDKTKGFVRSVVREDGMVISNASRIWPQTEAIRALCREDPKGLVWPNLVSAITDNLFAVHLPGCLNGGWIDQANEKGESTIDYMPASSLYHLLGAAIDSRVACQN